MLLLVPIYRSDLICCSQLPKLLRGCATVGAAAEPNDAYTSRSSVYASTNCCWPALWSCGDAVVAQEWLLMMVRTWEATQLDATHQPQLPRWSIRQNPGVRPLWAKLSLSHSRASRNGSLATSWAMTVEQTNRAVSVLLGSTLDTAFRTDAASSVSETKSSFSNGWMCYCRRRDGSFVCVLRR